jgi:asparagine synthase (glutamine-hydrolysing)
MRRLSIIDLASGQQPIFNETGDVVVIFNGEIYNYRELRERLVRQGHVFRTRSDTEVIVHLYEDLGELCLQELRGMFAIALWDSRRRRLLLARDRVGIKPLYYALSSRGLLFASEIKALLQDPGIPRVVNNAALFNFLSFSYNPGLETMITGVKKLAPGHFLSFENGRAEIRQYWDLLSHFPEDGNGSSRSEAELSELLDESVSLHLTSDVPVGFLLSGGIDSTVMLCLSAEKRREGLETFTIGFAGSGVEDERTYARLAATRYGVRHHETTITAGQFYDFLPEYVWHMEEPVFEPPAVSLYFVSKMARERVKVLISGEGGDEAFGGYPRYRNVLLLDAFRRLLGPATAPISAALGALGLRQLRAYAPLLDSGFDAFYRFGFASSPLDFFNARARSVYSPGFLDCLGDWPETMPMKGYLDRSRGKSLLSRMLYVDTKTWLPDDLLVKADKMTMAASLELRVPFLDHKVLEFAAGLPDRQKVRHRQTKRILKKAFAERIPRQILRRKKAGFLTPYEGWLRERADAVTELLTERRTVERGYFDRREICKHLIEPWRAGRGFSKEIFSLATLELWHRAFIDAGPASRVSPREQQGGSL